MIAFSELYRRLDETTRTNDKIDALADYFRIAEPASAAWTIYFLTGRKLKRVVNTRELRQACLDATQLPEWLLSESYEAVGDLAETVALLLPDDGVAIARPLSEWIENHLVPLQGMPEDQRRIALIDAWREQTRLQRFLWNKLLTGAFRVGVSQGLLVRGLSKALGVEPAMIEHRLMGNWTPTPAFFHSLAESSTSDDTARPYPFCLAYPLQDPPESLGRIEDWAAEWKWDGIRAQIVRRHGQTFIWSRGEELIAQQFPDLLQDAGKLIDGTVLDGEIVIFKDGRVQPFTTLQKRLNRRDPGRKLLTDFPATYIAFDVLEQAGSDIRSLPFGERRSRLREIVAAAFPDSGTARIHRAESHASTSWLELETIRSRSRESGVEGLMLKRLDSAYTAGRTTGTWWKWKIEPYTVDAVLIYAQRGSGRRASLYTDYTFGVWDGDQLVPFAKAYSGLTDVEIHSVDRFVREHTLDKFGPVRVVEPQLVFELAFENLQLSKRHKSGIAVRFPRIARWRTDKSPRDADTLETIRRLLVPTTAAVSD